MTKRRRRLLTSAQGCARQRATLGNQDKTDPNPERVADRFGCERFHICDHEFSTGWRCVWATPSGLRFHVLSLPRVARWRAQPWAGGGKRLRRSGFARLNRRGLVQYVKALSHRVREPLDYARLTSQLLRQLDRTLLCIALAKKLCLF